MIEPWPGSRVWLPGFFGAGSEVRHLQRTQPFVRAVMPALGRVQLAQPLQADSTIGGTVSMRVSAVYFSCWRGYVSWFSVRLNSGNECQTRGSSVWPVEGCSLCEWPELQRRLPDVR